MFSWIRNMPCPSSSFRCLSAEGEPALVADLIDSQRSEWKSSSVTSFFDHQVSKAILNTPINPFLHHDHLVWTETSSGTSVRRLDAWLVDYISNPRESLDFEVIAHLLWEIWKHRNNAVFRHSPLDSLLVVNEALSQRIIFKVIQPSPKKIQKGQISLGHGWTPPAEGFIKCNIDGAFRPASEQGSIACVYRDSRGILTDVLTRSMPAQSPFQAEIYALMSALQRIIQKGLHLQPLVIESDCLQLVEIVRTKQQPPCKESHLFAILEDLL